MQHGHFVKQAHFTAFVEEKSGSRSQIATSTKNPAVEIESMLKSLKAQLKDGENEASAHAAERESECHTNLKELLESLNEAKVRLSYFHSLLHVLYRSSSFSIISFSHSFPHSLFTGQDDGPT